MAIRNIVKEGDPILNKVCRPVTNFDDRLATLLDDMRETMIAADGVGLAGPQVGMMRRLFVVWDTTDAPEEIPEDYEYKFIDFVNPEILAVSEEEETAYEGCLSFPGHNGAVTRPVAVKVRAQDRNGEWFELEADGLLGRCISTRTTIWTASPSWNPASTSMRIPRKAKRPPAKRKETTDAHFVHGHAGYCCRVPESPVCCRARHLCRVHPAG